MRAFVIRRTLESLGLLLASTIAIFAMLRIMHGGSIASYLQNPRITPRDIVGLNHDLATGQPVVVQYFAWLGRILRGELGWSSSYGEPVSRAIGETLPGTVELWLAALVVSLAIGLVLGVARARMRTPVAGSALAAVVLVARSVPVVLLGLVLSLAAAILTRITTAGSVPSTTFDLGDRLVHLVVAVVVVAVPFGAWAGCVFTAAFRTANENATTFARRVVPPMIAAVALLGPALLAATVITERWFAWPGISRAFFGAFSQDDYDIVAGFLLLYALFIVTTKLAGDVYIAMTDTTTRRETGSRSGVASPRWTVALPKRVTAPAAACVAAFTIILVAPFFAGDPYYIDQVHWQGYPLAPGVGGHLIGTDENGRDLLARVLLGLRTSLIIAIIAALGATVVGTIIAAIRRQPGRLGDDAVLAVTGVRAFGAFPVIYVAIAVIAMAFGIKAVTPLTIALLLAAVSWPSIVTAVRHGPAQVIGAATGVAACALLLEVTLSFLGFGVQPPGPSLGNMFVNGQSNITNGPWVVIFPGLVVVAALCVLNAAADQLRARQR